MKKLFLLLPALLLVAGCSSEWSGEVRFKVRQIGEITSGPRVSLEVDGEKPKGLQGVISGGSATPDQLPADIKPGDIVICRVEQTDDNGFDGGNMKTDVGPCRRP